MCVSIIIPAYNEGPSLMRTISSVYETCKTFEFEVLVVIDSETDLSAKVVTPLLSQHRSLNLLVQNAKGPLNAIKHGISLSTGDFIVILTADDTDDIADIAKMVECFRAGAHYVSASRYVPAGFYSGGPIVKRYFSKAASHILELRHGSIASDPTNGFKGFSRYLYDSTKISGAVGFTYGLQLLEFAISHGLHSAVIPTRWHDRVEGASSFKMLRWMPSYLFWFFRVLKVRRVK
jgi:dolichol-phosphate mannosyltransferase